MGTNKSIWSGLLFFFFGSQPLPSPKIDLNGFFRIEINFVTSVNRKNDFWLDVINFIQLCDAQHHVM